MAEVARLEIRPFVYVEPWLQCPRPLAVDHPKTRRPDSARHNCVLITRRQSRLLGIRFYHAQLADAPGFIVNVSTRQSSDGYTRHLLLPQALILNTAEIENRVHIIGVCPFP